jgi:hypothetical protein
MSSILIRHDSGDWTPIQNGRAHNGVLGDFDMNFNSNRTYYETRSIDPKLIGKDCLICGQLTMVDFTLGGSYCAYIRTHTGFASQRYTFYSNREWTGGSNIPGSNKRTGIFLWQLMARPSASTITLQIRVDQNENTGSLTVWGAGDNQSNMCIFPVHTP